jgi:hypothetical protein
LYQPQGVAVDGSGYLYIGDTFNNYVRKLSLSSLALSNVGTANRPAGVAVNNAGTIVYNASQNDQNILKFTYNGSTWASSVFAGSVSSTSGRADGTGSAATFNYPQGLALDGATGDLWVSDTNNHLIRKITSAGVVTTIAGSGSAGSADGVGLAATFNNPVGIALDSSGLVYVGDYTLGAIRKIGRGTTLGIGVTLANPVTTDLSASNGYGAIAYTSSDTGLVTGVAAGTVTITATQAASATNATATKKFLVKVQITAPGIPTGVSAAYNGDASAIVSFTAPATGGSAITGYTVTATPASGSALTRSASSSPYTFTGLTNGTAYTFTVKATNAIGTGSDSTASSAVTPTTTPGAPTGVTPTASEGQVSVAFTAGSTGGSTITGYTVTATPTSGSAVTVAGTVSPIVVTGLTAGTAYTFKVKATNAVGTGTDSTATSAVTAYDTATRLVLTTNPATAASGSAFATQPVVKIQDASGTVVGNSTQQVTMTVSTGATVVGTSTVTASSGVATFSNVGISGVSGTAYTLTFATAPTAGTLTAATQSITVTEGPASGLNLTTSAAGAVSGSAFTTQPVVTIKDSGGNFITTSKTVTMTVSAGPSVLGTASVTTSNGTATFSNVGLSGLTSGSPYTLTYAVSGVTSATQTIALAAGAMNQLTLTQNAATAASGTAFVTQPIVKVTDSSGNIDTSNNTTLVTMSVSRGATTVGTVTATAVNGVATFTSAGISGSSSKTFTLTYSASGLTSATQTIAPTAGAAAQLLLSTYPGRAVSGSAFQVAPIVVIRDAGGNTITSSTAAITATLSTGASPVGTGTRNAVSGSATFTDLGITGTPGLSYTLTFSSGSLTPVSYTVTVLSALPTVPVSPSETRNTLGYNFTVLAGSVTSGSTDATGASATLTGARSMVLSNDGTALYFIDGNAVRMVNVSSGAVTTLAGSTSTAATTNATGTAARFNVPSGLSVMVACS